MTEIKYHYDCCADVLYASIDTPREAVGVKKGNGVILRVDPNTEEIVGFTVTDYMKRINKGILTSIPNFEGINLPRYSL